MKKGAELLFLLKLKSNLRSRYLTNVFFYSKIKDDYMKEGS